MRKSQRIFRHRSHVWLGVVGLTLLLFAAIIHGSHLSAPFIGDDYVFLDKVRALDFAGVWSRRNTDFGWYRPWSRELHFLTVHAIAGANERAFRLANLALWVALLLLYAAWVRRLAGARAATVATIGAACLALWGTPLAWISGVQDLWMLVAGLLCLNLHAAGRTHWAAFAFGISLLSKETAAVLPTVLWAHVQWIERGGWRVALLRTRRLWIIASVWFLAHPTLVHRLWGPAQTTFAEADPRPSLPILLIRTVGATINLDRWPRPEPLPAGPLLEIGMAGLLVTGGLVLSLSIAGLMRETNPSPSDPRRLAGFAVVWTLAGWAPLLVPSIGWHAYYGCFGTLGVWLLLSPPLAKRPRLAVAVILGLAILRGLQGATPSWDWGSEWYVRRAGHLLTVIRAGLQGLHPTLPDHSRVYFGNIPNNIGLIAGQSPAIRVWYQNPTLEGGFYSYYRPRSPQQRPGRDYFFRFDPEIGLVEVVPSDEAPGMRAPADPAWEVDHEKLAMLFVRTGDLRRAAVEFERLSELPHRPDAAGFSAICWERIGATNHADSLLVAAGARLSFSADTLRTWAQQLRGSIPVPGPSSP